MKRRRILALAVLILSCSAGFAQERPTLHETSDWFVGNMKYRGYFYTVQLRNLAAVVAEAAMQPSLQDTTSWISARLADAKATYLITLGSGSARIMDYVDGVRVDGCVLTFTQKYQYSSSGFSVNILQNRTTSFTVPFGKLAGASVKVVQRSRAAADQVITPDSVSVLQLRAPSEVMTFSLRIEDNGKVTTQQGSLKAVDIFSDDREIVDRLSKEYIYNI